MSSNPIFTSAISEERWVLQVAKNFVFHEHVLEIDFPKKFSVRIDIDMPYCVFKVPKTLTETKPAAYTPQKIGLGPYHHLRPELYVMHKHKLSAVRIFMNEEDLNNIDKAVEALSQYETVLRACYDQYLDLDAKTLAWIVAIDGMYLLQFLRKFSSKHKTRDEFSATKIIEQVNSTDEINVNDDPEFEEDILMLENQIPMVLLKVILLALGRDHIFFEDFAVFCREHSPLQLYGERLTHMPEHLLDYLHDLIVNNQIIVPTHRPAHPLPHRRMKSDESSAPSKWMGGAAQFSGTVMKAVTFYQNVPREEIKALPIWAKIKAWIKKHDPDEQNPLVEEIKVPSVTRMSEVAGITFAPTRGGIRDVDFKEPEKKFYLPVITVNVHTETVLRNLVAYELSIPGLSREFTLYVDLMCGIINTKKDVEILKNAAIIKGGLPDDDIVRIFNGIRRSTDENDKAVFNIRKAIDDVNVEYGNVWSVKVKRFVKKYFSYSWKHIRVVVSMVVVLLLTLQAYCSAFGCSRWFGGSGAVEGGHFLYPY